MKGGGWVGGGLFALNVGGKTEAFKGRVTVRCEVLGVVCRSYDL